MAKIMYESSTESAQQRSGAQGMSWLRSLLSRRDVLRVGAGGAAALAGRNKEALSQERAVLTATKRAAGRKKKLEKKAAHSIEQFYFHFIFL